MLIGGLLCERDTGFDRLHCFLGIADRGLAEGDSAQSLRGSLVPANFLLQGQRRLRSIQGFNLALPWGTCGAKEERRICLTLLSRSF